jgi:hypothetical protein
LLWTQNVSKFGQWVHSGTASRRTRGGLGSLWPALLCGRLYLIGVRCIRLGAGQLKLLPSLDELPNLLTSQFLYLEQIQFMNPFHRMFSLDNKAIMYPFAVHERVPVCTTLPARSCSLYTYSVSSMVGHTRRRDTLRYYTRLVCHVASRSTPNTSHGARATGSSDADIVPDGLDQECSGKTSSRSTLALQTRSRHVGQRAGRMDCMHRVQSANPARRLAQLPQWTQ